MSKRTVRIVCFILAFLMVAGVLFSVLPVMAGAVPTKAQLDELKDQSKSIGQKMQELESEINSLEYERKTVVAKKEVLDERIRLIQEDIDNIIAQIATYNALIDEMEVQIADLEVREAEQWELYKIRIRAMQENGTISYYAILFGARSFTDMLMRIDAINAIMEHDEKLYQDLIDAREATEQAKSDLQNTIYERQGMQAELLEAQAELEIQVEAATQLIIELDKNIEESEAVYDQMYEEQNEIKKEIAKMEEEIRQATAVRGTGTFIWPSDKAGRVTSFFGWRVHPVYGTPKNHNGVDIGGLGYGANVVAIDGGTVVTSRTSSSYGEYIVISHGNGYSSLYAHMSKRFVKEGDTVKQGDIIGLVGSTGVSNGPHIHLEIWYNGERVNPLDFYSNYDVSPNAW